MARQRENNVQTVEKYGTGMFYGAGPEAPTARPQNSYGATYANGQARPTFAPVTHSSAPAARPLATPGLPSNVRNENFCHDQIVLSHETREVNEGASWASVTPTTSTARGNSSGPAYSSDFRSALDALLSGHAFA